jgi:predicted RNA-binding Zn ribbon-like protein
MSNFNLTTDLGTAFGALTDLIDSSPERNGEEAMEDGADLEAFAERWELSYARVGSAAELNGVRHLRTRLERVISANDLPQVMDQINEMLFSSASTPQVVSHEGHDSPHMHFSLEDAPFIDKLTALLAMALAQLVVTGNFGRLRECANEECRMMFIDTSKNGSRLYHDSQSCGNRLHAARYRARQASLTEG